MDDRHRRGASWRDLRPGATYLAALAAGALLIFFIDVLERSLVEGPALVVTAPEARGLTPGADVWVAGVRAGRVLSIRFDDPSRPESGRVIVDAVLWRGAPSALRADAEARIVASALLAPVVLTLDPGSVDAPPWRPIDTLRAVPGVTPEAFAARAASARAALDSLATSAARLEARLREGPGTLASLRRDPSLAPRLAGAAGRVARLVPGEENSLRALLGDEALRAAGRRSASRLASLADAREPAVAAMEALAADLDRLGARLRSIGDGIEAGRGTAGRAVSDSEIQLQTRRLRAAVDSARAELAARPLRWLRVRLF